jgi:hypothetical protein
VAFKSTDFKGHFPNFEESFTMKRKRLEKAARLAIQNLRRNKLKLGFPFMINTHLLPSDQCYMEYPDGTIKLVTIDRDNRDFKVISELSSEECNYLRRKFKLN